MDSTILVTGVSGYIGGQTALLLSDLGYKVYGVDLKEPSKVISEILTGFSHSDFIDSKCFELISSINPSSIIHCAGTSLVGPSSIIPAEYYENNVIKTKRLMDFLRLPAHRHIRLIYSSSAAVYGNPIMVPCCEEDPALPISPYGESKYIVELMMKAYSQAYGLDFVAFRYFNACGADSQGRHGQAINSTHIIARILESIQGNTEFTLFGNQYPTEDGTCIRDYVHVEDIAQAHALAITPIVPAGIYNLGNSKGVSNLEIIAAAERITGAKINVKIGQERTGDPAILTASANKFTQAASWKTKYSIDNMIEHAWAWYNKQTV